MFDNFGKSEKAIEKAKARISEGNVKGYDDILRTRTDGYKPQWNKNGIIQFKNERIAILKRQWGSQVEFIIAFDDVTKEGYELKAIDEGKGQEGGIGGSGGISSYYYFQKGP